MSLLNILSRYKKEDAIQLEKEKYQVGLSKDEEELLEEIKDSPKPFDSLLNPPTLGQTIDLK